MKKIIPALIGLFAFTGMHAQCALTELTLQSRVNASDVIVEGQVIAKYSLWNTAHNMIYTVNTVDIYKVFKGDVNTSTIEIITEGGTVGDFMINADPALHLGIGDVGIFTCETVKHVKGTLQTRSSVPQYEAYGSVQGFIRYDLVNNTASDPFHTYRDVSNEIYPVLLPPGSPRYRIIKDFSIGNSSTQRIGPNIASVSISSFSPTTITAGTASQLTINGSGFGATRSSGTVGFKNADDGGATYINPLATQYISWSATQIIVEVPQNAGTGTIQVTQGTTATSAGTLTVSWGNLNANFDPGTGTQAYHTDHVNDNGSGGYTWQMNPGFAGNAPASASFMRAFDTWRCNTGINWTIGANTAVNDAVSDGTNCICFDNTAPLSAGILGVCYSYWNGCNPGSGFQWYVVELDIIFDDGSNISPDTWNYGPGLPTINQYDFQSVAVHELGHGHQNAHVINPGAIMHYAISNGAQNITPSADDLAAANNVQTKSLAGNTCGPSAMTSYTCATPPVADFSGSPTTLCAGGTVTFTDLSTNSPTSWSWTFQGGTPATSTSQNPTVTYNTAGTYSVSLTATNSSGSDTKNRLAYIIVNANPTVTVSSQTNVTCNTLCNGSATVTASGGTPGYAYSWIPSGGTSATAGSLCAGTYTCIVTDANGCTGTQTASITQPTAITHSGSSTPSSCSGSTGTATVSASGGTPGYTYSWAPVGGTAATASNLAGGTYTCTISDANGCTATQTVTVGTTSGPTATLSSQTNVTCNTLCNGSATITASGGTPGYTYAWTPSGGTGATASSLCAGTYTCTVTDAATCTATASVNITQPSALTVTAGGTATICSGNSATITASSSGGTGAVTFGWMPGSLSGASVSVTPAATTTYTVTGTDANGCTATSNVTITVNACGGSQLTATWCGATLASITQNFYWTATSGATNYHIRVQNASLGYSQVVTRTNNLTYTNLGVFTGILYSTTYNVDISAYVGGIWQSYGNVCTLTTPVTPTSQLSGSSCGLSGVTNATNLYYTSVPTATNYRIRMSNAGLGYTQVVTRGNNATYYRISSFTGILTNTTYNVEIAAYVAGVWGAYGTICTITTASALRYAAPDGTISDDGMSASISVYPNPSPGGNITITPNDFTSGAGQMTLELYDVLGNKVITQQVDFYNGAAIEFHPETELQRGIYILRAANGNESSSARIVVQ
ncbi:MAG: PKD domain-containing protein [Bacteroidetes bacterium]|nr:PKD domain-containing protein [Bacteroidota bacterium]